jgi:uncharacterized protein (DUF2384 family)
MTYFPERTMSRATFQQRLDALPLDDDTRDRILARFERLVGSVQDTYGMDREEAERFVENQVSGLDLEQAFTDGSSGR